MPTFVIPARRRRMRFSMRQTFHGKGGKLPEPPIIREHRGRNDAQLRARLEAVMGEDARARLGIEPK